MELNSNNKIDNNSNILVNEPGNEEINAQKEEQINGQEKKRQDEKQSVRKAVRNQLIIYGAIALAIFFLLRGFDFLLDCHRIIDQLATALNDQNIEIMDQIFDSGCEVWALDGKRRRYSSQRGYILENWETVDYEITSYDYDMFGWGTLGLIEHWISSTASYIITMQLVDDQGNNYELHIIMHINKRPFSTPKIISANAGIYFIK